MYKIGTCQMCGQVISLKVEAETEDEADMSATMHCKCDDACVLQARTKRIERAKARIDALFGPKAEQYGFQPIADAEIIDHLHTIAEMTGFMKLEKSALILPQGVKALIVRTGKGMIKIERKEVHVCQLEE